VTGQTLQIDQIPRAPANPLMGKRWLGRADLNLDARARRASSTRTCRLLGSARAVAGPRVLGWKSTPRRRCPPARLGTRLGKFAFERRDIQTMITCLRA